MSLRFRKGDPLTTVIPRPQTDRHSDEAALPPRWQRLLTAVPDAILVPLLWLCLTVSMSVMARAFTPWLVIPVVVVLSVATWRWRPGRYLERWGWQSALIALLGAVAWLAVNVPFASRWLTVTRDPGFLTLEGVWLTHHAGPNIPVSHISTIAAQIPGATVAGQAYNYSDGVLHVQGAKLVPGLAAMLGWVGGVEGVLVSNLVIGAIALLTFYGFARRFIGPVWSLVATGALAISMPFVAFTRSVYTEPLVVAVTFGGLTLIWAGYRAKRWSGFIAGGALLGAGGLARIDGAAVVMGLTLGLVLAALGTTSRARRAELRKYFLLASSASVVVTGLGIIELLVDSPQYTAALAPQWHELVAVTLGAFIIGVAVTVGPPWRWATVWIANRARVIGIVLTVVTLLVGIAFATRPLWYVARHYVPGSPFSNLAVGLENMEGIPADPTRSWDEQSLTWVAMYYSWIVVAAALIGLAFAVRRSFVKREPGLLIAVTIVAAPSLLYLWDISISSDQIWAMRRFLPVTLPGFLLFAAWTFRGICAWLIARQKDPIRLTGLIVACVVAVAGFGFPALTWARANLFTAVQYGGGVGQADALCKAVDGRPALVVGETATTYTPTITTLCGVDAVAVTTKMTATQLEVASRAFGSKQPVVITFDSTSVAWQGGAAPQPVSATPITMWPIVLNERPANPSVVLTGFWAGTIGADGEVIPISSP